MKRFRNYCFLVTFLFILAASINCGRVYAADNTISVGVPVTYGQTEARSMYAMINEFRTGSDAWEWNRDNTTKTVHQNLPELVYDYDLEKVAMQRAAEIAVCYSHTRPNGKLCFTAYSELGLSLRAAGENIAAGYGSAASVFRGWQETDEDYSGQEHRRNMLSSDFTAVGIGHVVYNNVHFWVQEFRSPAGNAAATSANDSETITEVEILKSNITDYSVQTDIQSLSIPYGDSQNLPELTLKIRTAETWPSRLVPVILPYEWTAEDGQIAEISDGKITGNSIGETNLTTSVSLIDTQTVNIPVTVAKREQTIEAESYTKTYGAKAFSLGASAEGELSYKSSNTSVATVSSTGTVTLKAPGKAVITIQAAETEYYKAAAKKVTVTVNPKKAAGVSVKAGKKQMTVSWKKDTTVTGYQITYAQNSKFTKGKSSVNIGKSSTIKKVVTKLKSKQTYYVKVRAYKTVGSTKIYGAYSTVKTVKVK